MGVDRCPYGDRENQARTRTCLRPHRRIRYERGAAPARKSIDIICEFICRRSTTQIVNNGSWYWTAEHSSSTSFMSRNSHARYSDTRLSGWFVRQPHSAGKLRYRCDCISKGFSPCRIHSALAEKRQTTLSSHNLKTEYWWLKQTIISSVILGYYSIFIEKQLISYRACLVVLSPSSNWIQ